MSESVALAGLARARVSWHRPVRGSRSFQSRFIPGGKVVRAKCCRSIEEEKKRAVAANRLESSTEVVTFRGGCAMDATRKVLIFARGISAS